MDGSIGMILFLVGGGVLIYILLMIFYPEWVGISGKSSRDTEEEHREGGVSDDSDFFSKKASAKDKPSQKPNS